jgi:hypothetical protein
MSNGRDPLEARRQADERAKQIPKFGDSALALSIGSKSAFRTPSTASNGATS